jgi:BirA family biotin operon repressor/biotin-[acetyl-CoA-carboxylase] ligase
MTEAVLRNSLADIPLRGIKYLSQTGSTNDTALTWAAEGAPDFCLVYTDDQLHGRGRGNRTWLSKPDDSLTFSLVLRPREDEFPFLQRFTALGALAVCEAVEALGAFPRIKWPNDILLKSRKFCGVLVDNVWQDDKVRTCVLGIGINLKPGTVPEAGCLSFPATCLEAEIGRIVDRFSFLHEILLAFNYWRALLTNSLFLRYWENHLAFRGENIRLLGEQGELCRGTLEGLERDGSLRLRRQDGSLGVYHAGEVHLSPLV